MRARIYHALASWFFRLEFWAHLNAYDGLAYVAGGVGDWAAYHYRITSHQCEPCQGSGSVLEVVSDAWILTPCPVCDGTGRQP